LCAAALFLVAQAIAAADPPATEPVPQASAEEVATWRQRVRDRIHEQLIVPLDVPSDARVELEVSLLPSGNAADVSTRRTSGFPAFDSAARRAVLAATPLPVPADLPGYERVRRFGAIFEPRSVQIVDAPAPVPPGQSAASPAAPAAAERFACAAGLGPAPAPDCSQSGSRNHLLTCFAQAVQRRAVRLVSACGAVAYPLEARRNRWEGSVQVGVSFDRGGRLAGIAVAESSGQPLLDQRALEIVQQAMVPPPPELYATPFAVRVPVVFRMQRPASADAKPPRSQMN
jgi:TonB family protein